MPKQSQLTVNLIKAEKDSLESFKTWTAHSSAASAALSAWAISEAGDAPELMNASLRISNILSACATAQSNYLTSLSGYRVSLQDVLAREASLKQTVRDREILLAKLIKASSKGPKSSVPASGPGSLEALQKELLACEAALRNETASLDGVKRRTFKEAMGMRMRCLDDMGQAWSRTAKEAIEVLDAVGTGSGGATGTPAKEKDLDEIIASARAASDARALDAISVTESLSPSASASQVNGHAGRHDLKRASEVPSSAHHSRTASASSASEAFSSGELTPASSVQDGTSPTSVPTVAVTVTTPGSEKETLFSATDVASSAKAGDAASILSNESRSKWRRSTYSSSRQGRPGSITSDGGMSRAESVKSSKSTKKSSAALEEERKAKEEAKKAKQRRDANLVIEEETASESETTVEGRGSKARGKEREAPQTKERLVVAHRGGGAELQSRRGLLRRHSSYTASINETAVEKAIIGDAALSDQPSYPEPAKKGFFGSLFGKKNKAEKAQTPTSRFLDRAQDDSDADSLPDEPRNRRFSVFGIGKKDTWSSRTDKNLSRVGQGERSGEKERSRRLKGRDDDVMSDIGTSRPSAAGNGLVRHVNEGGPPLWRNRVLSDASGELERAASIRTARPGSIRSARLPGPHQPPPARKATSDLGVGEWEGSGLHLRRGSMDFPPRDQAEVGSVRRLKGTSTKGGLARSGTLGSMSNVSVASAPSGGRNSVSRKKKPVSKAAANLMSIVDPPAAPLSPPPRSPLRNTTVAETTSSTSARGSGIPPVPVLPSRMAQDNSDAMSLLAAAEPSKQYGSEAPILSVPKAPSAIIPDPSISTSAAATTNQAPPPPPPLQLPSQMISATTDGAPQLQLPSQMAPTPLPMAMTSPTASTPATASSQASNRPQSILVNAGYASSDLSLASGGSNTGASLKRPKSVRIKSQADTREGTHVPTSSAAVSRAPPSLATTVAQARTARLQSEPPALAMASAPGSVTNAPPAEPEPVQQQQGWQSRIKEKAEGEVDVDSSEDEDGKEYRRARKMLSKADKGMAGME